MSVFIKETSGMDLTEYIGQSIYLRSGRSNNVIIDDKMFIHDVRALHFCNGDGSHCEVICYDKTRNRHSLYVYNVSSIVVESVYWTQHLFKDEDE